MARTSTVGGPSRRDVGRARQQEHFHNNSLQPLQLAILFNDQTTRNSNSTSPTTRKTNSEDCSVLYRSPSSGRSHGETDVIVRSEHSDWTGPSCGPPFWAGFRPDASLARPPGCKTSVIHRPCLVWSRRWNTQSAGLLHGARCDFASEAIVGGVPWVVVDFSSEMKWSGDKIKGKNDLIT